MLLEDYRFSEDMAYASHRLMVRSKDIEIGGVLGAALLSALLVDTEEGNRRSIAIDSEAEQRQWIARYEREVRREGWGMLPVELHLLSEAYIVIATGDTGLEDICPNSLLLDLAMQLTVRYMRYGLCKEFRSCLREYLRNFSKVPALYVAGDLAYHVAGIQPGFHTHYRDPRLVESLKDRGVHRRSSP